jgi:hypothetical protein
MTRVAIGAALGASAVLLVILGGSGQVSLTPAPASDLVSPQHQVRQDAAIEAIDAREAAHHADVVLRLDRVERLEDLIFAGIVIGFFGQAWTIAKTHANGRALAVIRPSTHRHRENT